MKTIEADRFDFGDDRWRGDEKERCRGGYRIAAV
jgi:hypothetical protein